MLKLVFTDLDGTFVDSSKRVPERNRRALGLAAEKGVQFVPCTGRNASGLPAELAQSEAVRYAVCGNGTSVVDLCANQVLRSITMGRDQVERLYELLADLPVTFDVFIGDKVYTQRSRLPIIHEAAGGNDTMERFFLGLRTICDCPLEEILDKGPVTKVTFLHPGNIHRDDVRAAIDSVGGLEWTYSLPNNTEAARAGANKGPALRWLCDYLGVDLADVVAFGDGDNDILMIEAAGDGVAMANAIPEALAAADHVTGSCDEAGVAAYLEPILAAL